MEYQEARYILNNFRRLTTELERKAMHQYSLSNKLGNPDNYSKEQFEKRKELFKNRMGYIETSELLNMFEGGYENFAIKTAERIKKDSPNEYCLNTCPNCNLLARTPYAKQCRKCGNDWHNEIAGEFQFDTSFRITGKLYLWIVGELLEGHLQIGYRIDLTNFQMNIISEIKQIEFCLKSVNGIKKDLPSLGIEVGKEKEELIKKYLTKSAKTIMILKEKEHGG